MGTFLVTTLMSIGGIIGWFLSVEWDDPRARSKAQFTANRNLTQLALESYNGLTADPVTGQISICEITDASKRQPVYRNWCMKGAEYIVLFDDAERLTWADIDECVQQWTRVCDELNPPPVPPKPGIWSNTSTVAFPANTTTTGSTNTTMTGNNSFTMTPTNLKPADKVISNRRRVSMRQRRAAAAMAAAAEEAAAAANKRDIPKGFSVPQRYADACMVYDLKQRNHMLERICFLEVKLDIQPTFKSVDSCKAFWFNFCDPGQPDIEGHPELPPPPPPPPPPSQRPPTSTPDGPPTFGEPRRPTFDEMLHHYHRITQNENGVEWKREVQV